MATDDEDGRNGDDPLENGLPPIVTEYKRKLRSDYMNKYEYENGIDSKRNRTVHDMTMDSAQEQNGVKRNRTETQGTTHTHTEQTKGARKKTLTEKNKQTDRQNRDRTDAEYKDEWIKNMDYTTFIIERLNNETNQGSNKVTYPHPMEVAKMLANIKVNNYKQMKSVGRGRFQLTFNKPRDAEQLINSKLLTEEFRYKVYVPTMFKQTIGVVRDVAKTLSEQEIMDNMNSGKIKIEKVERIMKMTTEKKLVPTFSIKIYAKGQYLPRSVEIYGVNALCEPYIFPLRICYKCWRYGHAQKYCKAGSVKCCKCGLEHEEKDCKTTTLKCINCGLAHKASDRNCPERDRQDKIRTEMALNKLSYIEAQQKYPKQQKSVQSRLNLNRDFPKLPDIDSDNESTELNNHGAHSLLRGKLEKKKKDQKQLSFQKNKFPEPEQYEEAPHVFKPNPFTTTDIEKLVHQIKKELIAHFNLTGIVEKIQAIQNTILKNTDKTETIEQDLLLINISNQLDTIINPEIFYETRAESISSTNSQNGTDTI